MSATSNKELVRRALETISTDLEAAGELFAPEFVRHLPGGAENRGRAAFLESEAVALAAMGNPRVTVLDILAEGDRVAARFRSDGKHVGPLLGIPATGVAFSLHGLGIFRVSGGKIAELWEEFDSGSLIAQLRKP